MTSYLAAYWQIVRDCMVKFYDMDEADALVLIRDYRLRLQQGPQDFLPDFIYHEEPLRLAARLAGKAEPQSPDEKQLYREIRHRRIAEAAALGTEEEVQRGPAVANAA